MGKNAFHLMKEDGQQGQEHYAGVLHDQLARLQALAGQVGAVLVVMYIPDIAQVHHPETQHINRMLRDLTARRGIVFLDMTSVFEDNEDLTTYYLWPRDAHTNPRGHAAMAKALAEALCQIDTRLTGPCGSDHHQIPRPSVASSP